MIAARFAAISHGGDRKSDQGRKSTFDSLSNLDAAAMVNVSKDVVKDARVVLTHAPAETIAKVGLN